MAPFPESEDMTIKRLVVALRKNDLQLLKMGAYKLHEKFHTGYDFELIDDLKKIMEYVQSKHIPPEISDILCSTIKEILAKKEAPEDISDIAKAINSTNDVIDIEGAVENALKNTLGENTQNSEIKRNTYYDTPGSTPSSSPVVEKFVNPLENINNSNSLIDNAVEKAVDQVIVKPIQLDNKQVNTNIEKQNNTETTVQLQIPAESKENTDTEDKKEENNTTTSSETTENKSAALNDILIFYDDYKNETDYSKVKDYRNNLNFLFSQNSTYQDYNILKQIASLTNVMDTETNDIDKIISAISTLKTKISFVTTSQSENVSKTFVQRGIDFEIPYVKKPKNEKNAFNLIPMLGFTNIFVCSNCNSRSLKTDFNTRTLSVQCPHCDSASFPDIYAVNSYNPDCNPIFWHRAFAAFVKSKTWILINPPLDENKEIIFDFIKAAFEASAPDGVYILSKENDKKEVYRQMFASINPNIPVKTSYTSADKLCEDFIKEEITKKVFS